MGKAVPKTKQAENSGLIAVAQFAHRLGWAWRPTPNDDYGLDGELEPITDGKATGQIIKVQVKSGQSYRKNEDDKGFYYLAAKDDLGYWDNVNVPVLLVIHDPDARRTYGVEVHAALAAEPSIRATRRIQFDKKTHLLNSSAESRLLNASNGNEVTGRIFRRSPSSGYSEALYSNVLSARTIPARIYGAPTDCRTSADVRAALGDRRKTPAVPSDAMLWTFADLTSTDCSLRVACDPTKTQQWLFRDWMSGQPDRHRLAIRLMNTCFRKKLAARGVIFDRDKNRHYFPPEDGHERRLTWQSLHNKITRPVAYPHRRGDGTTDYWVHWAATFRFIFFGAELYLLVEPAMVFTRDGVSLVGGEEMGRLSTSRRSHQYNRNVLGMLFFWRELLLAGENEIVVFPAPPPQRLSFYSDYALANAAFGIDGDRIPIKSLVDDIDDVDLAIESDEVRDYAEADDQDEHDDSQFG